MSNNKLCIVPCGSAKIWDKDPNRGPTEAQHIYTGVFAAACQRYAKAFYENWMILSAKYGFLMPEDVIPGPYDVSFLKASNEQITMEALKDQARDKKFYDYTNIVVLGGKHYVSRIQALLKEHQNLSLPLSDCKGMGYMLQKISQSLETNNEATAEPYVASYSQPKISNKALNSSAIKGKYTPLHSWLLELQTDSVSLTISEVENILGFPLPASAYQYRAWWSNDISHSQAKSWLFAGWITNKVNLPYISFIRDEDTL